MAKVVIQVQVKCIIIIRTPNITIHKEKHIDIDRYTLHGRIIMVLFRTPACLYPIITDLISRQ